MKETGFLGKLLRQIGLFVTFLVRPNMRSGSWVSIEGIRQAGEISRPVFTPPLHLSVGVKLAACDRFGRFAYWDKKELVHGEESPGLFFCQRAEVKGENARMKVHSAPKITSIFLHFRPMQKSERFFFHKQAIFPFWKVALSLALGLCKSCAQRTNRLPSWRWYSVPRIYHMSPLKAFLSAPHSAKWRPKIAASPRKKYPPNVAVPKSWGIANDFQNHHEKGEAPRKREIFVYVW